MNRTLLALAALLLGAPPIPPMPPPPRIPPPPPLQRPQLPPAIVILYEHEEFRGRPLELRATSMNLVQNDFNDMASSARVRVGYRVTFFEDTDGQGAYFVFNCSKPIGTRSLAEFCDIKSIGQQVSTGWFCPLRTGAVGCQGWWNDRISGVRIDGPADEHQPQGIIDDGHS